MNGFDKDGNPLPLTDDTAGQELYAFSHERERKVRGAVCGGDGCHLFHNQGDGTFEDATARSKIPARTTGTCRIRSTL